MTSKVTAALQSLLPKQPPPSLSSRPSRLYEVLSRYPQDGVGQRVHQLRWGYKGIVGSYWLVTRAKLKLEGTHGKAWGQLYWKGQKVGKEEQIPGGLKYSWAIGSSHLPPAPKAQSPTS